jgi:Cu2+-exporting ATPase/Cu+-exporting ATPase
VIMMAVPPLAAVLAMAASSLSVTLNTARLAWAEPDEGLSDSPMPALSAQRSMPPSAGQSRPTA